MKTTRTFFVVFVLMLLASTALMGSCIEITGIKGDGNVVKEERQVSGFTSLEVSGAFEVYLYQGKSESLTLEADKNLMEIIVTEVKGDKLHIYTRENIKKATELNVYLTFEELEMIDISGAVSIEGEGMLEFDELYLDGSGASEINLEMNVKALHADFSGASEIELSGSAGSASFDFSGASELDAIDFEIKHCELDVSGAAEAKVNVSTNLEVNVSGAASVKYKGNPNISKDVSGAGSIKQY
jgi:hypothetical protein